MAKANDVVVVVCMRNTFKLCPLIDIICTNRRAEGARGEITDNTDNTDTVNVCVIDRQ